MVKKEHIHLYGDLDKDSVNFRHDENFLSKLWKLDKQLEQKDIM